MLKNTLTLTQKKTILVSMLKELDYLFCSDSVTKKFHNEYGDEVKIELETSDGEEVAWEVLVNGKQEVVAFSQMKDFVDDFLKVNEECGFI